MGVHTNAFVWFDSMWSAPPSAPSNGIDLHKEMCEISLRLIESSKLCYIESLKIKAPIEGMCKSRMKIALHDGEKLMYPSKSVPRSPQRKVSGSRGILIAVYFQVSIFLIYWSLYYNNWYRSAALESSYVRHASNDHHPTRVVQMDEATLPQSNIFVGISYSDKTVSDAAIHVLLEAACVHGMESYILLGKRDSQFSLSRKITLFSEHKYMTLAESGTKQRHCTNLIHIVTAPNEKELIQQTRARLVDDGANISVLQSNRRVPNNPLDRENRIANIKRAREYQRQMLRNIFNARDYDLEHSVIAVLDLDMFAYPTLAQVLDASEKYIRPSDPDSTKYHAICANGLQGAGHKLSNHHREYYDTFATILLPDLWLHSKRAHMSQSEVLSWFIEEGKDESHGELSNHPVPVQSCFGGFTMYRADAWLDSNCRYDVYNEKETEFIGHKEHHTCEHVVLHQCLREKYGGGAFSIAVQPELLTLWHLV